MTCCHEKLCIIWHVRSVNSANIYKVGLKKNLIVFVFLITVYFSGSKCMLGDAVFECQLVWMWGQRSKPQCETPRCVCAFHSCWLQLSWQYATGGGGFIKRSPPHHTNTHICALDQCHCNFSYFKAERATRIMHIPKTPWHMHTIRECLS